MAAIAKLNNLRMAPRKVRLVADLIRGKSALEAKSVLRFLPQRAARAFAKLLDSAMANAKNNFGLEESTLYLAKVTVDEGAKLKRWRARARGRAFPIQKKTSHLTIVLEEKQSGEKKTKKTVLRKEKTERPEAVSKQAKPEKPDKKREKAKFVPAMPKSVVSRSPGTSEMGSKRIFKRKAF